MLSIEEGQYREKVAIWAVLSTMPLYAPLADNRVWRWFAANIPSDLGTGGHHATDFDLVVATLDMPRSWTEKRYHTFEVKVAVIGPEGRARSLKAGKTQRTLNQVAWHRQFGSPQYSLLDVFLCLPGFFEAHAFPTDEIAAVGVRRAMGLHDLGAGYRVLPFEATPTEDPRNPPVLRSLHSGLSLESAIHLTVPRPQQPSDRFLMLMERIDEFASRSGLGNQRQIVYCRCCRELVAVTMKVDHICPSCGDDLIRQF